MTLVPERWFLTLGTKAEHEDAIGSDLQPSARLLFVPSSRQSWWCSISRAVRTPSQAEQDVELVQAIIPGIPDQWITILGSRDIQPETIDALELGWRMRVLEDLECDVAVHLDRYHDLIVFEPGAPFLSGGDLIVPLYPTNAPKADGFGVETHVDWAARDDTRVTLAWTLLAIDVDPGDAQSPATEVAEDTHPDTQWSLRAQHDFDERWRCDFTLLRVDDVESGAVPDYWRVDADAHRKLGQNGGRHVRRAELAARRRDGVRQRVLLRIERDTHRVLRAGGLEPVTELPIRAACAIARRQLGRACQRANSSRSRSGASPRLSSVRRGSGNVAHQSSVSRTVTSSGRNVSPARIAFDTSSVQ